MCVSVDSSRPGTAMLDIEPFVKLLRTLVVSVSESSLNRCCMSKASRCDELSQRENTEVVFLILVVHSTAKSGSSGSSEKLGGLFLDFFMVELGHHARERRVVSPLVFIVSSS